MLHKSMPMALFGALGYFPVWMLLLTEALIFPQIKVYSESGGKLQTHWDQSQKGTVTDYNNDRQRVLSLINWSMKSHTFVKLSLAEYVFVSLCLALVIARLFPAVHNHIVSKATRLEHQSLYWGMVVVSNTFVYGLLFAAAKGWSIFYSGVLSDIIYFGYYYFDTTKRTIIVSVLLEVVISAVLFCGALFASLKSRNSSHGVVPRTIGKFFINLSFCWSCFCVCVCCSKRCRAKTMSVLVMFSLMVFLHHNIMEAISFGFALFIEPTRIIVITIGLLYISFMVFFVFSISLLIFIFRGRNTRTPLLSTVYQSCWNRYSAFDYFWFTWTYDCFIHDHILLPENTSFQWDSDWTDTLHCSVSCLLVHQEEAGEGTEPAKHRHDTARVWGNCWNCQWWREQGQWWAEDAAAMST